MRRFVVPALLALAIFAAGWYVRQPSAPPVRYERVVVTDTVLLRGEPTVEVRWRERIVTRVVRPEQEATAPDTGQEDVESFCAEYVRSLQPDTVRDTIRVPDPRLLVRSWSYDGRDLEVWGPQSDGDLWRGSYRARPPYTVRADGDSLVVRSSKLWWVDDAIRAGLYVGGGYLLGRIVP